MKKNVHIYTIAAAFLMTICLSCDNTNNRVNDRAHTGNVNRNVDNNISNIICDNINTTVRQPTRIISFAPSITEILFALDLGDNVAGVTQFCNYPPAAKSKAKLGAYSEHNYESILRLRPDLAIILREQTDLVTFFDRYDIDYITVGSDSVGDILASIREVAKAAGAENRGIMLVDSLRERMNQLSVVTTGQPSTRSSTSATSTPSPNNTAASANKVLLCAGRGRGGGIAAIYAAGARSFYNELIHMAGGANVLSHVDFAYPSLSAEAILRFDPDVIIDISSAYAPPESDMFCGDWLSLRNVSAVKNDRVHCLSGDYLTIPGPRFVTILEHFARYLR